MPINESELARQSESAAYWMARAREWTEYLSDAAATNDLETAKLCCEGLWRALLAVDDALDAAERAT